MTALAWLPPEDPKFRRIFDQERFFHSAWKTANDRLVAPMEAEPMQLLDSLGRSWWVLSGGPWAPLELLLQSWPTPPESVLADWRSQRADWESLGANLPWIDSNRSKDETLPNDQHEITSKNSQRWWVDRQGALLPFLDLWSLLHQLANSLRAASQASAREEDHTLTLKPKSKVPADRSPRERQTAPKRQPTLATLRSKSRSKPQGDGPLLPTSRKASGKRSRAAFLWAGAVTFGLLGVLIPRFFLRDSNPVATQSRQESGQRMEPREANEFQPTHPTPSEPAETVAENLPDPLDLRGLSPTDQTVQPQPGLELNAPNLFPDGDLKTKLDRILSGSPGELLANTTTTESLPEAPDTETEGSTEILDSDSTDQTTPDIDSAGIAPGPERQSPVSLEDRSFPVENLPLRSKWILRDRGLDPLLSLVLELEDLDGWEWNRMPIPLEEGKVVRSWGRHKDHPEAGGMVIQASLRKGRVWQVEVDVGWSPTLESPPVRLSIEQADKWLAEVQSGLRWHDQALQQLRQTRNLTSNSSQRSLMLDQIRTLEGQQRDLKDLESRWQKVATLAQVFYGQQVFHLRWQTGSSQVAAPQVIPKSP
jgi:hypothetical protein